MGELDLLSVAEAAKRFPKIDGCHPSPKVVRRWAQRGIGGIRLESQRVGKRIVIAPDAIDRFLEELNELETV